MSVINVLNRKNNLTRHLRIHREERPFKCDVCDKRFKWKRCLTVQLRTHNRNTPMKQFKCDVCDKRFSWKKSLTRHLRVHSSE